MINENFMIVSEALYKKHTQKQTIIVLGLILLVSGGIIYRLYNIAEEQNADNNDLIKRNHNLSFVNANLNKAKERLNAEVLYYIDQNVALIADKKKEATSKLGKQVTQNNQA